MSRSSIVIGLAVVVIASASFLAGKRARARSSSSDKMSLSVHKEQTKQVSLPHLHGGKKGLVISAAADGGRLASWAQHGDVTIVAPSASEGPTGCDVVVIEDPLLLLDDTLLAKALASLKAGGRLLIAGGDPAIIRGKLALAGFVDSVASTSGVIEGMSVTLALSGVILCTVLPRACSLVITNC
jgi:hypothetical protein